MFFAVSVDRECVTLVGDCVRRALKRMSMKHDSAAKEMGIAPAELSRMVNTRGANFARLLMLGPVFMGYFQIELRHALKEQWACDVFPAEERPVKRWSELEGAR